MKIDHVSFQMRNDFHADMSCEHCGATHKLTSGYNDDYYHQNVIPAMTCKTCGLNRAGDAPAVKNDDGTRNV